MPYAPDYAAPDPSLLVRYDANKRSAVVAYILWFFLGTLGAHRFYLARYMSGTVLLLLSLISLPLSLILIGHFGFGIVGIWLFIDLFLIPGMTSDYNNRLIASLRL
jgi:TM2 domain-containing membrane protein YozV